jgi:DNA-binding beta-propeller fold protein YncE
MAFSRQPEANEQLEVGNALTTERNGHTDTLYSIVYFAGANWPQQRQMKAVVQADGNFVIYRCHYDNHYAVWATNTCGKGVAPYNLSIDPQGNVLLVDGLGSEVWRMPHRQPIERQPCRLVMQHDGNLVLYDTANCAIWASDTAGKSGW